jgi:glutaredoxin
MKLKVFTQPTCPRCPAAKQLVKQVEHKFQVEFLDIKTEDGLAEALEYDIMATPSLVVLDHDNNVVRQWSVEMPDSEELINLK